VSALAVNLQSPSAGTPSESLMSRLSRTLSSTIAALTPRSNPPATPAELADIPERFVAACNGNRNKAKAKWEACKRWREENHIDTMLERPYPKFLAIKKCYSQQLHGRGLHGEFISYEVPALLDTDGLRAAGVTPEEMGIHLAFIFEYACTKVDPSETACSITIMDCKNLSLTKAVSRDNLALVRSTTEVIEKYYPGRCKKIIAINTPRFFGPVFNVIKGVLPGNMGSVIEIARQEDLTK
jgi:hypothetical protein